MALPDTRTQILDAAEHLFAERGYRGTSIRAITDLAGANLAAVRYHFGSKAELMSAVARRVVEPVNAAQCAGLDRLLAGTADPGVAELVEAFAGPLFDGMPAGDEGGARRSRLIVMILSDPAEEVRGWAGAGQDTVGERYLAAFARAARSLPGGAVVALRRARGRPRRRPRGSGADGAGHPVGHGRSPFQAAIELWAASRTDPQLRAALLPAERRLGSELRKLFNQHTGIADAEAARTAFESLMALVRGLELTRIMRTDQTLADRVVDDWLTHLARLRE
jgi:AcrR family transcriptional regulator